MRDELGEKIARVASELEDALGDESGQVRLDLSQDITLSGDRVGYTRLAVELLKVAAPPAAGEIPAPDHSLLNSPFAGFDRDDAMKAPSPTSWKGRLIAGGCIVFGLFALAVFVRGCNAFTDDLQRLLR